MYFVPAFSGLFAPHWRETARGAIVGLTRYANRGHIARAALEATAYQTREVLEAMEHDSAYPDQGAARRRRHGRQRAADAVPGGHARRAGRATTITETTALGAAYAAGLAVGYWSGREELARNWGVDRRWHPENGRRREHAALPIVAKSGYAVFRLDRESGSAELNNN